MNRRSGCAYILGITLLFNLFLALPWLIGLAHALRAPLTAPAKGREPFRSAMNFTYQLAPGWESDDGVRSALAANIALRRKSPAVWVAVGARDVKVRELDDGELLDEGLKKLRPAFRSFAHEPPMASVVADKPAQRVVFQGERGDVLMSGELRAVQHHGYAYWIASWCRADEVKQAAGEVGEAVGRFGLADQRADWKPELREFTGTKAAYTLTAPAELWKPSGFPAANYDPSADLALEGREPGADAADRRATVLVLVLPKAADAIAAAKDHVLARQKETYAETTVEELKSDGGDRPVVTLKMVNTESRTRFVALTAVKQGDGVIAVVGECGYVARSSWEGSLRQVMTSLKVNP